jgi:hypothetical protein
MSWAELAAELRRVHGGLTALRPRVEAGQPWPLSERFDHSDEARWGPPELLAHVAEMLGFWRRQADHVLDGPEGPVPFGRVATDEARLQSIARDRTLDVDVLYDRIAAEIAEWESRFTELTDRDEARVGVHPTLGDMPVDRIVQRFVIGHLDEHRQQLEGIVARRE